MRHFPPASRAAHPSTLARSRPARHNHPPYLILSTACQTIILQPSISTQTLVPRNRSPPATPRLGQRSRFQVRTSLTRAISLWPTRLGSNQHMKVRQPPDRLQVRRVREPVSGGWNRHISFPQDPKLTQGRAHSPQRLMFLFRPPPPDERSDLPPWPGLLRLARGGVVCGRAGPAAEPEGLDVGPAVCRVPTLR